MLRGSGNKSKSKMASAKVDTVIGHQTEIVGDVHFSGGLHVDGVIKGNVYAEADSEAVAIISDRGRVEGELRVPTMLINGYIAGDVYSNARLDIARNARIRGDVYYNTLEMAGGAEVNGKLMHTDQDARGYLEHDGSKAAAGENAREADSGGDESAEADPSASSTAAGSGFTPPR